MKKYEHPIFGTMYLVPMLTGQKAKSGMVLMTREFNGKLVTNSYDLVSLPFTISTKTLKRFGYKPKQVDSDYFKMLEKTRKTLYSKDGADVIIVGNNDLSSSEIKKILKQLGEQD